MRSTLHSPALFAVLALLASAGNAGAVATDYLFEWGSLGTAAGQFSSPSGVALGPAGHVYVLDQGNQRIQKFDADGQFLAQWVSARAFQGPMQSLAVGPDGSVYVQATYWVQKYDANGIYQFNWGPTGGSSAQSHEVTIDAAGNVCVTFWLNGASETDRYSPTGTLLGTAFGEGFAYYSTVFDIDGDAFYVSGESPLGVPAILKRTSDGSVTSWPASATRLGLDVLGNLYASDYPGSRVQIFDNSGTAITVFGTPGSGPGQFNGPLGVAVSSSGRIYVADRNNHRIQVFGSVATPVQPVSWGRMKAQYR